MPLGRRKQSGRIAGDRAIYNRRSPSLESWRLLPAWTLAPLVRYLHHPFPDHACCPTTRKELR
jgi:hypothetical protein